MRERLGQLLKIACAVLAALLLLEIVLAIARSNPLAHVAIPAIPSWSADAQAPTEAKAADSSPANTLTKRGTNDQSGAGAADPTHLAPVVASDKSGTNASAGAESVDVGANALPAHGSEKASANSIARAEPTSPETHSPLTQSQADEIARIMPPGFSPPKATNTVETPAPANAGTNAASAVAAKARPNLGPHPDLAMMGMRGTPGMGKKLPDLSIETKALVNRITDSELLGPVIHPMPMGLLGIAGSHAFLRTDSGQTGMVKEGDSLGELKVLKIGINRVLVEQDGEKKELTIFDGYGGESLLPKAKENYDQSAKK